MINNIEELFTFIVDSCINNDIILRNMDNKEELHLNYFIDEIKVNDVLSIIANTCTINEYSFSILRNKYAQIKVILFDKYTDKTFTIIFFTQIPDSINSTLAKKHEKKVSLLSKLKIIPIIGPDGVGKTTLTKQMAKDLNQKIINIKFKRIIRRSTIYNILYPINKWILGKKPEKNQHDDTHYLLSICAGLGFYPYLIFQTLLRKKIFLIDRYFYDYLLKDISYLDRTTYLREDWKKLLKFIPRSYLLVHLDADTRIILARKKELTADDIIKYRTLNFTLYLNNPSVIYLYVNTGIEIDQCKKIILSTLKESNIIAK